MPRLTAIYVDFTSASSHRAWRWLSLLPERAHVDVRPYWLDRGRSPWDRVGPAPDLDLLALGEFVRAERPQAHHAFVDAAFSIVHEERADLACPETWLALGARVGLRLDLFTADSERWRAEVGLWQAEATDDLGVVDVPSLVFDGHPALLLRLREDLPDAAAARGLLDEVAAVAAGPTGSRRGG